MPLFDSDYLSMLLRLVTAMVLGGVIGFERAGKNHDAGLRTHILVCIGSAAVMILSQNIIEQYNIKSEIMRMGAQVISGIGFLGIGTIITTGDKIKGLTTAAGLWTTACVGLAVGMGYYKIAITVVVLMLIAVLGLRPLASHLHNRGSYNTINIIIKDKVQIIKILTTLSEVGINIISVKINDQNEDGFFNVQLETNAKKGFEIENLIGNISLFDEVKEVSIL